MTIAAVLGSKGHAVETISADDRLFEAVRRLGEKRIGALPVIENGRIAGIMSERDVIYCLRDHGPEVLEWPVSRVMSSPAIEHKPAHNPACPRAAIVPIFVLDVVCRGAYIAPALFGGASAAWEWRTPARCT